MVQRGWSLPNATFTYTYEGKAFDQKASLGYDNFLIGKKDTYTFTELVNGDEVTTSAGSYLFLDLAYEAQWALPDSSVNRVCIGGGVYGQLGSLNQGYAYPSFGYTLFFGIGPSAALQRAVDERTTVHGDLSIPLLAWVARSP